MALKGLNQFNRFDVDGFFKDKTLVFVKAEKWEERDDKNNITGILGSKVVIQVYEDNTAYSKEDIDNFGEQVTVKVRDVPQTAYKPHYQPLATEVVITDVEKVSIYGDYKNQLSLIAAIKTREEVTAKSK